MPTGLLAFSVLAHLTNPSTHSVYAHNRSWSGNRWRERYRERVRGRCVGVREETENSIIPHCLQRIGTSLQDISASSSLWLVGDVSALKLPQVPRRLVWYGKARSLPSRSSLALITPGSMLMRRAAVRPSTRAINHSSVGFVYLIGRAEGGAGESSPISPPQIQPAPLLSSVCQQV